MAFLSSLLKWLVVGVILVAFPWTIPIALACLFVKAGFLGKVLVTFKALWKKGRIFECVSNWSACRCKSLKKETFALDYYLPTRESPYVILVDGAGFLCVSSFSILDSSRSPEAYRRVVGGVLKALGGGARRISFVGSATDEGDFLNCLQIVSRHVPSTKEGFERAGVEQMELLEIARTVVGAESPTAEIRVYRGKDIMKKALVMR